MRFVGLLRFVPLVAIVGRITVVRVAPSMRLMAHCRVLTFVCVVWILSILRAVPAVSFVRFLTNFPSVSVMPIFPGIGCLAVIGNLWVTSLERVIQPERVIMTKMVRDAFAECGGFYESLGKGVNAFCDALWGFDLYPRPMDLADIRGVAGRKVCEIRDEFGSCVGHACLAWHRDRDGNWDFEGHIA